MGKPENSVAHYLIGRIKKVGGLCEKIHCESERGFPDYLITWPRGTMKKVETKVADGVLSTAQLNYMQKSAKRRCFVAVLWSQADVDTFMDMHAYEWESIGLRS